MNLCQRKITVITLTVLLVFNSQSSFALSGYLDTLYAGGKRFINSGIHYAHRHPILSGIAACSIVAGAILGKQMLYKPLKPRKMLSRKKLLYNAAISDTDKSNLGLLLFEAIEAGDKEEVIKLISLGVDVNKSVFKRKMRPPLIVAIENGKNDILCCLLEHGANVNARCKIADLEMTPLAIAIYLNNLDIVACLVEHGADINVGIIDNEFKETTPLKFAIFRNELAIVKYFIEHGASVNAFDSERRPLLHCAAYYGSLEIVKFLIEQGANLYAVDSYGYFAVDYAENEEIKRYLFSNGAMSKSDFDGLKYYDENEAIKEENRFIVMLFSAIYAGDAERVQNLIALGADVNAVLMNNNGSVESSLKLAVFCGEVAIVELLVEAGADINKVDSYGWSVLDYAKNKDVMEYLIGKGVKSKYGDVTGMLHDAIRDGEIDRVEILVELGADVNAKYDGISSLDLALSRNKIGIAKCLIAHGADVNAGTSTGWTCLHCVLSNFELVKMLVEAGADINKIDKYGHLPLDRAEDEEIRNYLISKGAKSN